MTIEHTYKNLQVPSCGIDVVLDTDAYNEIDDQFAISYLISYKDRLNIKAIYAAPFHNSRSVSAKDGMEKSYAEIEKLLSLMGEKFDVFKGSVSFLADENTPVTSCAALDLVERARGYSPERPLYVVAIGAITNVASALIMAPEIAQNLVIVWLGGHAHHYSDTYEFNMCQDVAAARVVMKSPCAFVQLPCMGVVSAFTLSKPELEFWLKGKNKLCDYLADAVISEADGYAKGTPWTRVIWDVTAVAWLVNDDSRFLQSRIITRPLPSYDNLYSTNNLGLPQRYIYNVARDALMADLFRRITEKFN